MVIRIYTCDKTVYDHTTVEISLSSVYYTNFNFLDFIIFMKDVTTGGSLLKIYAAAAAKSLQSCLTLWDPMDSSPPGSAAPGILQARTLGWVAISFSNSWKWKVKVKSLIRVRPSATPWTAAFQAPTSMGFSRQEYWSGMPLLKKLNTKVSLFFLCNSLPV